MKRDRRRASRRSLLGAAPVLLVVGGLSVAALLDAVASSATTVGPSGAGHSALRTVIGLPGFWSSFAFSVYVALGGTLLAAAGAVALGHRWCIRPRDRQTARMVLHFNLGVPHLVWAVALVALLSPSGWISRITSLLGATNGSNGFPVLVNDGFGIGIVLHLATKELPFVLLATLPLAGAATRRALAQAATLGAGTLSQIRYVYLPAIAPALIPAVIASFAFGLGGYEPGAVLGVQRPRTLAVVALEWFRSPDLAMRHQAFAVAVVLMATVAIVSSALLVVTRGWWTLRTVPARRDRART